MFKNGLLVAITAITLSSFVFIIYTGDLYYKTFILSHKIQVLIQSLELQQKNESFLVKSTFLIKNPSSFTLKISYLKEEIYRDSHFRYMIGQKFKRSASTNPGSYLITINPFSNGTLSITTNIDEVPNHGKLFIKVTVFIPDIPIVNALYVTRYLLWVL